MLKRKQCPEKHLCELRGVQVEAGGGQDHLEVHLEDHLEVHRVQDHLEMHRVQDHLEVHRVQGLLQLRQGVLGGRSTGRKPTDSIARSWRS